MEDGGEEDGDAPADDKRQHHVDRPAEHGSYAEEAQVEHQDRAFDRRDQGAVEDFDAVDDLREDHLVVLGDDLNVLAGAVVRGDEVEGGGAEVEDQAYDDEAVVPPERGGG